MRRVWPYVVAALTFVTVPLSATAGDAPLLGPGREAGLRLATALFSRSRGDQDRVDAYTWSHLAAELDPVQAATSARGVIEKYCNDEQTKRGKAAMAEWKRKWSNEPRSR